MILFFFFFSSRRRHTSSDRDWSSDVCSSDLAPGKLFRARITTPAPGADSIHAEIDTGACLARAVAALNALTPSPDITIVTGDLVDHGEPAEYDHLRLLLAPLRMPVFVIAGNHDSRAPIRQAFGADGYFPPDGFL